MSKNDLVAHAMVQFRLFRIPHPRLLSIKDEIDTLRTVGRLSRADWERKGRKVARIPQKFLAIVGPSGSGKSTSILHYLETVLAPEVHDEEIRPVVHVTLSSQATTKRLGSDILDAYGDPDFEQGTATSLLGRASTTIETAETDVLVLDEIHHLHNAEHNTTAWSVTETIKRMLIRGSCPLILIGTEEAKPLLLNNRQFVNRCLAPIFLNPLDVHDPSEWRTFVEHCGGFDLKLVEHGIFDGFSGLMEGDVPACLYEISDGVIGEASNVFEAAALLAIKRGATRIELIDLENGTDAWAMALGVALRNPFRHGVGQLKRRKAA